MWYIIITVKERNTTTAKRQKYKEVFKMNTKSANEVIAAYKDMTCYFDESMTQSDMYNMLRYRMQFGEAETRVIIAALIVAGAKFKETV